MRCLISDISNFYKKIFLSTDVENFTIILNSLHYSFIRFFKRCKGPQNNYLDGRYYPLYKNFFIMTLP